MTLQAALRFAVFRVEALIEEKFGGRNNWFRQNLRADRLHLFPRHWTNKQPVRVAKTKKGHEAYERSDSRISHGDFPVVGAAACFQ